MKKYITLAALLSAGAAFANAGEVEQDFSFTEASSTVPLDTAIDLTKDWELVFSAKFDPTSEAAPFVSLVASETVLSISPALYGDGMSGMISLVVGETYDMVDVSWDGLPLYYDNTFSLVYSAGAKTLGFAVSYAYNGVPAGNYVEKQFTDVVFSEGVSISTLSTAVSSEMVSAGWTLPTGTITGTAIPEPSAFGLLAGLGALALVGTRRRRK